MAENPTPDAPSPRQVWRAPDGRPMLYVRSEVRPALDGDEKREEHLFVLPMYELRHFGTKWIDAAEPLTGHELIYDPEASERAERLARELADAKAEVRALTAAMRSAVGVIPADVAAELRRVYREQRGETLRGRS